MKPSLFLFPVFLLAIHTSTAFSAPKLKCPDGIGSSGGRAPEVSMSSNGTKILVCGYVDTEKSKGPKKHMSEFDVYFIPAKGKVSPSIRMVGALDNFIVYPKGSALVFEELVFAGAWVPGFVDELTCTKEDCVFSKPKCVFRPFKEKDTRALDEFKTYVSGKNKGKVPDDSLVYKLSNLALSGNKEAQDIFLKDNKGLALDGATAEGFASAATTINRLLEARCL